MPARDPLRLLVICTGNRARSQMTEGWIRALGDGRAAVSSAGTQPKGVHPITIQVMSEVGIDLSAHTSDHADRYLNDEFDLVLTVCDAARETCPVFPGARRTLHHSFEDPNDPDLSEQELTAVFRRIRDEIGEFARRLLKAELG